MTALLPCPFCSKPLEIVGDDEFGYHWTHESANCPLERDANTSGWKWDEIIEIVEVFNHRPLEDSLTADLARLRELLGEALPLLTHIDNSITVKQEDEIISRIQSELKE